MAEVQDIFTTIMCLKLRTCTTQILVLHQTTITSSSVGMFVTAKIEEDKGCIVQNIIASVPLSERLKNTTIIVPVTQKLLGWFYKNNIMDKGYLNNTGLPDQMDKYMITVMISCAKLIYGHYKSIIENSKYNPSLPIQLCKHHIGLQ